MKITRYYYLVLFGVTWRVKYCSENIPCPYGKNARKLAKASTKTTKRDADTPSKRTHITAGNQHGAVGATHNSHF